MEEEKAAAYYNELLGKGRNAALFKQGLGFGAAPASAPKQHPGIINFVGAGQATEPEKDSDAPASKYGKIGFVGAGKATEPPPDRDVAAQTRAKLTKKSSEDVTEKRVKRERRDNNKGTSPSRSHASPRDWRHRSRSRSKERSRSKRSSESPPRKRRSRSRDRGRRNSRSRSRDRSHKYHKDRSRSRNRGHKYDKDRNRSRDRSRSRERRRHQRDRRSRSRESERRRRSRSRSRERSRRDYKESRRSVSPGRRSDRRQDGHGRREVRAGRKVERDQDWATLIPGFDSMTPAEKVKAKMKLQLSQTVVKDTGKGVEEEWERFDFNKDAPLDDDAKQDYFGDGTGASTDDIARIDNLGGSHLFVTEQAKREARLQAAHEAAIFGAPVVVEVEHTRRRSNRRERERSVSDDGYDNDNESAPAKVAGVLSEQIIALQAGSSWQERIKKMRAAQAQDESLNSE